MDQIQKQVSEIAIRLLTLNPDSASSEPRLLEELERLARQLLREIESLRLKNPCPGSLTGEWPIYRPRS